MLVETGFHGHAQTRTNRLRRKEREAVVYIKLLSSEPRIGLAIKVSQSRSPEGESLWLCMNEAEATELARGLLDMAKTLLEVSHASL